MIKTTGIDSLTNFQKNAKAFINKLEKTREPMVLTVNGKAKAVLLDADSYQELVDDAEKIRMVAAVKDGLKQLDEGNSRAAEEVYAEMKAKFDL